MWAKLDSRGEILEGQSLHHQLFLFHIHHVNSGLRIRFLVDEFEFIGCGNECDFRVVVHSNVFRPWRGIQPHTTFFESFVQEILHGIIECACKFRMSNYQQNWKEDPKNTFKKSNVWNGIQITKQSLLKLEITEKEAQQYFSNISQKVPN